MSVNASRSTEMGFLSLNDLNLAPLSEALAGQPLHHEGESALLPQKLRPTKCNPAGFNRKGDL